MARWDGDLRNQPHQALDEDELLLMFPYDPGQNPVVGPARTRAIADYLSSGEPSQAAAGRLGGAFAVTSIKSPPRQI